MDYDILNEARGVCVSFCQPVDVCVFEEMKLYLHFDAELALLLNPLFCAVDRAREFGTTPGLARPKTWCLCCCRG